MNNAIIDKLHGTIASQERSNQLETCSEYCRVERGDPSV